ncbi:MAG: glycosyltransferase family 39 protein [Coriobacteriia bacterium]
MSERGPSPRRRTWERWIAPAVVIAAIALVWYKVRIAVEVGPGWDTYAFLANAAEFAGKSIGYTEPHRPPLLSFLTSIAFRVGPLEQSVIQWIDGAFTASGVIAVFLLFRRRVPELLAGAAALALLGVTPLWDYLGVGYTDTAAIALSAWALVAAIAATERNPRWYLLTGALFACAALMRFTALLFAFPLLVWVVLRWRPFPQAKHLLGAVIAGIAVYVPAGAYYAQRFGDPLFPFLFAFSINETITTPGGEGTAAGQALYYLKGLPGFLGQGAIGWILVVIAAMGLLGVYYAVTSDLSESRRGIRSYALALFGIGVAVAPQFGAGLIARQVAIPLGVLLVFRGLARHEGSPGAPGTRVVPAVALDAAMLTWLLTYLDFHGHQAIQVPRYFVTMAVPLLYLTALGWAKYADIATRALLIRGSETTREARLATAGIMTVIVAALLAAPLGAAVATPRDVDPFVAAARDSANWLRVHDPAIAKRVVYSDLWPYTSWYLGSPAKAMPSFEETSAYGHELDKTHADYFVTVTAIPFATYRAAHRSGASVVVLERISADSEALPRVLYLGSSWDNYLETLTDYSLYLESTAGRYGWEGSAFLDAYSADELSRYDAVAVAGFRWKRHGVGEQALDEYVRGGGVAVIDASQNLGGLAFSIADVIFLDTVVRRTTVPANAEISVSPAFAAGHPELGAVTASPWADETGGAWAGATYEARPGTPPLETLASAGNRPIVQLQHLGKGRIYWIGLNLPWHAFSHGNDDEARLVREVLDEALTQADRGRP